MKLVALCLLAAMSTAEAREPTLKEYRYARALAIDLVGRAPTLQEVAALERDDFSFDEYIDKLLRGGAYAARLRRIYLDVLRLEDSPAFTYAPPVAVLHRVPILGPDGKTQWLYFRNNQRRARPETDGELCLSSAELGFTFSNNNLKATGELVKVPQSVLDKYTVVVRPWWLYADWDTPEPMMLVGKVGRPLDPAAQPAPELLTESDGRPTVEVRVCREEAQANETGTYWVSGRPPQPKPDKNAPKPDPMAPQPFGRARPLPGDDGYAQKHVGQPLSCRSALSVTQSIDCGCGVGLIGCMPGADGGNDPRAFSLPPRVVAGFAPVIAPAPQNVSAWFRHWWAEEAVHFFDKVFGEDRDLRELLTGRYTHVNGPLAHFYRYAAQGNLGGRERQFEMVTESEPLLDPARLPILWPLDASTWKPIVDRGPHAAGLLTMPIFLTKYASRRARAAALYSAFWCKSFVAGDDPLTPSTEPNLMIRPGCSSCHATLEPLAAYFSRVEEASWTHLADWQFPLRSLQCKRNKDGKLPGFCDPFYDIAFSDEQQGLLRGAYASIDHAAAGPVGAAEAFTASPAFARCATERITSSFLGRPVTGDDEALLASLTQTLVKGGMKSRALVRAIVTSPVYRRMSAGGP